MLIICASILLLLLAYSIYIYNSLIKESNLTKESWSGVEVQLKQRANLIPNIVATVQAYAADEKKVFQDVTELRAACMGTHDPAVRAENENALTASLKSILAVAENYPELKANENFLSLQKTLSDVENKIQAARRYYNATVRDLNILIESVPSNLVAKTCKFEKAVYFKLDDIKDRESPDVDM